VKLITEFTDHIRELGLLGESEGMSLEKLKLRLSAARSVAANLKLRTRFARVAEELRKADDYSSQVIEAKMSEKLYEAISREMENCHR
jgi:hypothetical protein